MGDRATARAHGADVERGRAHGHVAHRGLAPLARHAVEDQRDIGGGAAHVEREQILVAGLPGNPERTGDAAGGAAHQYVDRRVSAGLDRGQPAVRAQDVKVRIDLALRQLLLEVADVDLDHGRYVGVGDRGDRALVLVHLRQDLGRDRDRDAGHDLVGDLADPLLVDAAGIGVHQANGQRFDPARLELGKLLTQIVFVQPAYHIAARAGALLGLDGELQRRQRFGLGPDDPAGEDAGHEGTGDLQHLPVALGGHETDAGALPFQDGVGRDRGAVHHVGDRGRLDARVIAHSLDAIEHANRGILRSGRHFRAIGAAARFVDQQEIGERPADVHPQTKRHVSSFRSPGSGAAAVGRPLQPPASASVRSPRLPAMAARPSRPMPSRLSLRCRNRRRFAVSE